MPQHDSIVSLMNPATTEDQLLEQLIEVGRQADAKRLISASGGNVSGRLPGSNRFFITGTGTWLGELTPESFAVMNLNGDVVGGTLAPSSEYKVHLFTYRARPDVNSVVHLHPQTTVLLDALGKRIEPMTLDQAGYLRTIERIGFYDNGSDELGNEAARAAAASNIVIMAHHGCSSLGDSVGMAYRRALNLEEAAAATFNAQVIAGGTASFPLELLPPESVATV